MPFPRPGLLVAVAVLVHASPLWGQFSIPTTASVENGRIAHLPDLKAGSLDQIQINEGQTVEAFLANGLSELTECTSSPPPTDLSGLTDGFTVFNYSMTTSAAAKLNIPFTNLAGTGDKRVFVHDFMFYKKDEDSCGNPQTWGAGVRVIITARSVSASANLISLPAVAASAQFSFAETQYTFATIGMSGPKIAAVAPNAGSYDIEKHVELMKAMDNIRDLATDPTTVITPRLVSVDVREDDVYIDQLARVMALRAFANNRSCQNAKGSLANNHSATADAAVEAVYKELMNKCTGDKPTNPVLLARIAEFLRLSGWKE